MAALKNGKTRIKERLIKAQGGGARSAASRSSLAPLLVSGGVSQRFLKFQYSIQWLMMPRMRSYLTRAGYASTLSGVSADILKVAKEVYSEAMEAADPLAAVAELTSDEISEELLPKQLQGSASFSAMVFTLGKAFDGRIDALFSAGEPLRAVLFDAWGSEAVEALACNVDRELREIRGGESEGTIRFAPGYGGFDIRRNVDWLGLIKKNVGDAAVEVEADKTTGILSPRKTIVCMIGWPV